MRYQNTPNACTCPTSSVLSRSGFAINPSRHRHLNHRNASPCNNVFSEPLRTHVNTLARFPGALKIAFRGLPFDPSPLTVIATNWWLASPTAKPDSPVRKAMKELACPALVAGLSVPSRAGYGTRSSDKRFAPSIRGTTKI